MSQRKMLLIFLMALCLFNTGYGESRKDVEAVVAEFPNYIFHLLTLGKIVPEDFEYLSFYEGSISEKDQIYLNEHRGLLGWGDGTVGPLTAFFMFIPGYIDFQSQTEFDEYFDLLCRALRDRDFDIFIHKYDAYFSKMELMFGPRDIQADLQGLARYADVVFKLGDIYKRNFQAYHLNVWPKEKEKLEKTANSLNHELQKYDFINHWEQLTRLKFKTDQYQIVLISANKNGPNANSLGYDRNAFYYNLDPPMLLQFISHEVGTHLLIDDFRLVMQMNRFEYRDVYKAFENMAEFYNVKCIFKGKPLYGYDIEKYDRIYAALFNSNRNLSPKELMIKGLEIYTAQRK